jgi:hypothetical protein
MATAKELRVWANTVRHWAMQIDDKRTADQAFSLAAEMDGLATRKDVSDRQLA